MKHMYWKFFGAFWIALACTAILVALGIWCVRILDLEAPTNRELRRMQLTMRVTTHVLEAGQLSLLHQVNEVLNLNHGQQEIDVQPWVLDSEGRDFLGKKLKEGVWENIRTTPGQLDPKLARQDIGLVHRMILPDGRPITIIVPMEKAHSLLSRPPPLWIVLSAVLIIGAGFGAVASWSVVRPLQKLGLAVNKIAAGDLNVRVQPLIGERKDELGQLGRDIDNMINRLQLLIGAQQRLMHDVSHELRSPLARMEAAIEVAQQQPERVPEMFQRVQRESHRLNHLVDEVLTLARLESGIMHVEPQSIDLIDLLIDACDDARFEAEASGKNLVATVCDTFVRVADGEMLFGAFENVLRNAVRYTNIGTAVLVEARVEGEKLVVVIEDEGPGLPPEGHDKIFEPFWRGIGATGGGVGLGMAIAHRAIQAHSGMISVNSRGQTGTGLVITMKIPAIGMSSVSRSNISARDVFVN